MAARPNGGQPDTPTRDDVVAADRRLGGLVHRTPVLRCTTLDERSGATVFLKSEHLQKVGAFKARGAMNAVAQLPTDVHRVACHSSGNHAQALAWAAAQRGLAATIVMPSNAPSVKRAAVEGYGAEIVTCDPTLEARETTLSQVIESTGAVEIHPYDHPHVIAGAGTAALELLEDVPDLDVIIAPVGGGGLLSGTALAAAGATVWGAEPLGADDAARSLAAGRLIPQTDPQTIADGLLTSLSDRTFGIISERVERIVTVTEAEIISAMRLLWERAKQVVEPSGAVAVAAVLQGELRGRRVGVILSGGNVDLDALPW
jgi:threonine dehydratase